MIEAPTPTPMFRALVAVVLAAAPVGAQTSPGAAPVARTDATTGSMRITGLPGETKNDKTKRMEIMGWSFGGSTAGSTTPCTAAPGSFTFRKLVDGASVSIQKAKAARTRLAGVQFDTDTQSFRFQDAQISSYQPAPTPGDSKSTPMEEKVTIRFGRCERVR